MSLHQLTDVQKSQLRNAFTLIDGESRDSKITTNDLKVLYKTLGLQVPSDSQLKQMLNDSDGINFTEFSKIMASQFSQFDDKDTIASALKVFGEDEVDLENLKQACCSVQLGEIGSGDHRLTRKEFDELVNGFVKEGIDGKKILMAKKWMAAYFE